MKKCKLNIKSNTEISPGMYRMELEGSEAFETRPGQFINIEVLEKFLRRPISICDRPDERSVTIIYKVVGSGTEIMSKLGPGHDLDCLVGLGNGYDLAQAGERPLLVGGGAGVPPLYYLAKELIKEGKKVTIIAGFGSAKEVYYEEEFSNLGAEVIITTLDGTQGIKGLVTDAMDAINPMAAPDAINSVGAAEQTPTHLYACGPLPMLRAIAEKADADCQLSLEARMGCGFGACMGCSIKTRSGHKRVCKEGPVFRKDEIIWED